MAIAVRLPPTLRASGWAPTSMVVYSTVSTAVYQVHWSRHYFITLFFAYIIFLAVHTAVLEYESLDTNLDNLRH